MSAKTPAAETAVPSETAATTTVAAGGRVPTAVLRNKGQSGDLEEEGQRGERRDSTEATHKHIINLIPGARPKICSRQKCGPEGF